MASDLETKANAPKYEAFVDKQLAQVRTRIRARDAGRSMLLLAIVSAAYFLLMAGLDLAFKDADDSLLVGLRLGAFATYVLAMIVLTGQLGMRLYRRINPFYAAKQLEETIPH